MAEVAEVADRVPLRRARAALPVVQATTSDTKPVWPEALSNACCPPSGQVLTPVLEVVVALTITLVKPASFAVRGREKVLCKGLG